VRSELNDYHEDMNDAVLSPRAMFYLGKASEGADISAKLAALEGRYEDAGRWILRYLWAEHCIEAAQRIEARKGSLECVLVDAFREALDAYDVTSDD
jgi:hypothetical protein